MKTNQMKKSHLIFAAALGLGAFALAAPGTSTAQITNLPCVTCHTMHDMQDGIQVTVGGPYNVLLTDSCLGCHSGTNGAGGVNAAGIPSVVDLAGNPMGATNLAGGDFFYGTLLGAQETYTHNLTVLDGGADGTLGTVPPGGNDLSLAGGAGLLSCGGITGCHGDRTQADPASEAQSYAAISGAHHGDDSVINGLTTAASFRFLTGMIGRESTVWEYGAPAGDHNSYFAKARLSDADIADAGAGTLTMSGLCAKCHPDFHNTVTAANANPGIQGSAWGNPWVRHPTDYDMSLEVGEYTGYAAYSIEAPIGRTTIGGNDNTGHGSLNGAIVICLSCHRAHGSDQPDLLRWDYAGMIAGGGVGQTPGVGCFRCHTTKD